MNPKKSKGFTDEEKAAMRERAKELKAEACGQRQGGRGKRRACGDFRYAGTGTRHGKASPRDHQSQRANPLAEDLVWNARVCKQGGQGRLLLPKRDPFADDVANIWQAAKTNPSWLSNFHFNR